MSCAPQTILKLTCYNIAVLAEIVVYKYGDMGQHCTLKFFQKEKKYILVVFLGQRKTCVTLYWDIKDIQKTFFACDSEGNLALFV